MWIRLRCRMTELMMEDEGMSTVEYPNVCVYTRRVNIIRSTRKSPLKCSYRPLDHVQVPPSATFP